jgi:hypothetical protein
MINGDGAELLEERKGNERQGGRTVRTEASVGSLRTPEMLLRRFWWW